MTNFNQPFPFGIFYRPRRRVSVILFIGEGVSLLDRDPHPCGQRTPPQERTWDQTGSDIIHPPELTSSLGHCSSQYTSYWNAFLFVIFSHKEHQDISLDLFWLFLKYVISRHKRHKHQPPSIIPTISPRVKGVSIPEQCFSVPPSPTSEHKGASQYEQMF